MNENSIVALSPKQKGNITELQCITSFCELGYDVNIPYGNNARYDFVADINDNMIKIQVKTCQVVDNGSAITFSCRSSHLGSNGVYHKHYSKDEIDFFCTHYKGKCYLVPAEECGTEKCLRFIPPKNNQKAMVTYADQYELSAQLQKILNKN